MSGNGRRRVAGVLLAVGLINVTGWALFLLVVLPNHTSYGGLGIGLGAAITAWTLGMRHAFDADHIAAIDNATRKLMADGQHSAGSGFFFALGHAGVVMLVAVALAVAAKSVAGTVLTADSQFDTGASLIGTVLSAGFLLAIAALNLVVALGILRVFRGLRHGEYSESELEAQLEARGLMHRFFGRLTRAVSRSWHLAGVGFVFGIGFDTATEVLLLAGTAAAATEGLPWFAVLALPLLFAGGMTLFDSLDGLFMNHAYSWALARPVRKVYYNLVVTGLSVLVAFSVGSIEVVGLISDQLDVHGWLVDAVAQIDFNTLGYVVVGLFAAIWATALVVWRFGRVETRWEAHLVP